MKRKSDIKLIIIIIIFSIITFFTLWSAINEKMLVHYFCEDGPAEWLQAIFLLLSFIVFSINFIRSLRKGESPDLIALVISLVSLFAFLEEISYGQRLFGIKSPYYFERHNVHREINIHNLLPLDSATEIASFAIFLVWGIILPFILLIKKDWRKFADKKIKYIPSTTIAIFCLAGLLIEIACRHLYRQYWPMSNEILELYLYAAIFAVGFNLTPILLNKGKETAQEE